MTLINMAMSAPASTGVHEVEVVILDEMRLHRGEVTVPRHQPQPFLKFANHRLAEEAASMHCIQHLSRHLRHHLSAMVAGC